MSIASGNDGQFFVNGTRVLRCTAWTLDESRPLLSNRPVNSWAKSYVPGRRSGTGTATVLYDPEDSAANALFSSVLDNPEAASEIPVEAVLQASTGTSYPVSVLVSSVSHAVAKGQAQQRNITFRASDVSLEVLITGATTIVLGATQPYTAQVFGLTGSWTYSWSITSGPTIISPSTQTTGITFPGLGTFTLTVTATLGAVSVTDSITLEVIDYPHMWISRSTSAKSNPSGVYNGATAFDTANQYVYHCAASSPDVSVGPVGNILSKLDYFGTRVASKRFSGFGTGAEEWFCSCIQPLSNGDVFVAFDRFNEQIWMRVTGDLSSIVWQKKMAGLTQSRSMAWGCYDETVQRLFFIVWGSATPGVYTDYIGYINVATGAVTMLDVTPTPLADITAGRPIKLASGKILFVYGKAQGVVFMECNNDLKVGGVFAPIKTVEHTFASSTYSSRVDAVETDNYIAVIGASDIGIFNKSNYAHVRTIRRSSVTGEQVADFYRGGELVITMNSGSDIRILKANEGLTAFTTQVAIYPTSGGSVVVPGRSNQQAPGGAGPCYDSTLGLFAFHQHQISFASGVGEMVVFCRDSYTADDSLDYGPYDLVITVETPISFSTLTPTGTFNRSYSFATYTPPTVTTPSITIANETSMTFSSYVLS